MDIYELGTRTALRKHKTRYIILTLLVYDFEIKFTSRQDEEHIFSAQEYLYVITEDWEGNVFRINP